MEVIDLRSDTVTKPTPEMWEAMATARVGDDVYGEDPSVNRLQELAAEVTGKEAGLFVASGTMGNLTALLAHCGRGDEVMVGNKAHIFLYEAGGASALGGIASCQLLNQADGGLVLADIEAAVRADDPHEPISRLICLENTHNRCGGTFQNAAYTCLVADFAHERGLAVHLDGARVFNASIAQGIDVKELTGPVDSITFCLSKGLCAPVGSVLCGSRDFIRKAHRIRKMLGGGMRQAGILAAAGIVALGKMISRLDEDHTRAKCLADGLKKVPGLSVMEPATNMVFISLNEAVPYTILEVMDRLKEKKILVGDVGPRSFRLVLHYWIDDNGVAAVIDAFNKVLK